MIGIRIDELDPTILPDRDHLLAAMLDDVTVQLTVAQILGLISAEDVAAFVGDRLKLDGTNVGANAAALRAALGVAYNDAAAKAAFRLNLGVAYNDATAQALFRANIGVPFSTAAEKMAMRVNIAAVGNLHKQTIITASGTHTYDTETKLVEVELVGAGGGGGGATVGAGGSTAAPGGNAGSSVFKMFLKNAIATATIAIGAKGIGVLNAAGTTGGDSTYSDGVNSMTAKGGILGAAAVGGSPWYAQAGGVPNPASTGGDTSLDGDRGGSSWLYAAGGFYMTLSGEGGLHPRGRRGGKSVQYNNGGTSGGNGENATGYGAGGSGAICYNSGGSFKGGDGAPGVCIIREYK